MSRMTKIVKVEPYKKDSLCMIYEMIKASCEDYKFLERRQFDECINSIYICTEYDTFGFATNIYGMVGVRETTMEDIGVEKLKYYCKKSHKIYSMEFLHYSYHGSTPYPPSYVSDESVYMKLLRESLADKNDGFVVFRPHCPTGRTPEYHKYLIEFGFEIEDYNSLTEQYTYVKSPTVWGGINSREYLDDEELYRIPSF